MSTLSLFAPAKLNLLLAITGRRSDGYHDLVSVVARLEFGDTLHAESAGAWSLTCDAADVPVDGSNLVLRAARLFSAATNGAFGAAAFRLEKRIPVGAGLGGGSSDAVAALRWLNDRAGRPLGMERLAELAAELGSDCPLFLHDGPLVMRGRGERVTPLPPEAAARLRGRRVLVFKPAFGVATAWAYARLAAMGPRAYFPETEAESALAAWLNDREAPLERLLLNSMEPPVFHKYIALPTLLDQLRDQFGLAAHLSGSGSACFSLLEKTADSAPIIAAIRDAWGETAFVVDTFLL